MQTKLKTILLTAVCTTLGWVVILFCIFRFWPSGNSMALVEFPPPGEPGALQWQPQKGEYLVQLVSSNATTSATSILFARTSRAPERIWFQTSIINK